ncbi:MAG: hypothetical protein MZV63_52785 [Marinilabiliales bacterium]|nr:hypothetical protein [Marinilabiliales bacterium]
MSLSWQSRHLWYLHHDVLSSIRAWEAKADSGLRPASAKSCHHAVFFRGKRIEDINGPVASCPAAA